MYSEKGLTLVELLAVIVILGIISLISVVSISKIITNTQAKTHLSNARVVLDVGIMAHLTDEPPTGEFYGAKKYSLNDLVEMDYLVDVIKNPNFFSNWTTGNEDVYDLEHSLVVVDERTTPTAYKVNLSMGGPGFIFTEPVKMEDINSSNFSDTMKLQLKIK